MAQTPKAGDTQEQSERRSEERTQRRQPVEGKAEAALEGASDQNGHKGHVCDLGTNNGAGHLVTIH